MRPKTEEFAKNQPTAGFTIMRAYECSVGIIVASEIADAMTLRDVYSSSTSIR